MTGDAFDHSAECLNRVGDSVNLADWDITLAACALLNGVSTVNDAVADPGADSGAGLDTLKVLLII